MIFFSTIEHHTENFEPFLHHLSTFLVKNLLKMPFFVSEMGKNKKNSLKVANFRR